MKTYKELYRGFQNVYVSSQAHEKRILPSNYYDILGLRLRYLPPLD